MVYTCLEITIHSLLEVPDEFNTQLHQDPAKPPIGQTLKKKNIQPRVKPSGYFGFAKLMTYKACADR